MRILVTGASGFVGSRTCAYLEKAGHEIIRISHSNPSGVKDEYLLDIAKPEAFEKIKHIGGVDAIVHCAGIAHRFAKTSKEMFWRVNVDGS